MGQRQSGVCQPFVSYGGTDLPYRKWRNLVFFRNPVLGRDQKNDGIKLRRDCDGIAPGVALTSDLNHYKMVVVKRRHKTNGFFRKAVFLCLLL